MKTADTPSEIGSTLIESAKEAGIYEDLLTVKKTLNLNSHYYSLLKAWICTDKCKSVLCY